MFRWALFWFYGMDRILSVFSGKKCNDRGIIPKSTFFYSLDFWNDNATSYDLSDINFINNYSIFFLIHSISKLSICLSISCSYFQSNYIHNAETSDFECDSVHSSSSCFVYSNASQQFFLVEVHKYFREKIVQNYDRIVDTSTILW